MATLHLNSTKASRLRAPELKVVSTRSETTGDTDLSFYTTIRLCLELNKGKEPNSLIRRLAFRARAHRLFKKDIKIIALIMKTKQPYEIIKPALELHAQATGIEL